MKSQLTVSLCAAVAMAAFTCPSLAQAQNGGNRQQSNPSYQSPPPAQPMHPRAQANDNNSNWGNQNAQAQTGRRNSSWGQQNGQTANRRGNSAQAQQQAMKMVPAEAKLTKTINAKKAHAGQTVTAKLQHPVHLKNGPELPRGTVLTGKVTMDRVQPKNVRVAVRFSQAKLNSHTTIPVKATVVAVTTPQTQMPSQGNIRMQNDGNMGMQSGGNMGMQNGNMGMQPQGNSGNQPGGNAGMQGSSMPGAPMASNNGMATGNETGMPRMQRNGNSQSANASYAAVWSPNMLRIAQINVTPGVNMHSRIASHNSAVFTSRSKKNVKIDAGSQMTVALAELPQNGQATRRRENAPTQ